MIQNRDNNGRIIKKYTDDYLIPLCEEYKVNKNAKEISIRENIVLGTLHYHIKRLGYSLPKRKHSLNEKYFRNINSKNKAYILGFLMADGCVCKSEKKKKNYDRLTIQISSKDRCVLEFIKKELECSYEIIDKIPKGTYSSNPVSILTINSTILVADLIKLGIIPNKTGHEKLPDIKENLKKDFVRGFLDGDGCITNSSCSTTIRFISSKEMLKDIKYYIDNSIDVKSKATIHEDYRTEKQGKNIYYLTYSHREDISNIKKLLYKNATFYLERKYSKLP